MSAPPEWMTPPGITDVRRNQIERDWRERDRRKLPRVPLPVDVNDAARFPEIAAAREWVAGLSPERRAGLWDVEPAQVLKESSRG